MSKIVDLWKWCSGVEPIITKYSVYTMQGGWECLEVLCLYNENPRLTKTHD